MTDAERTILEDYLERPLIYSPIEELHAVYSKMVERGEWYILCDFMVSKYLDTFESPDKDEKYPASAVDSFAFMAWLFCLNATDQIEERMSMAAEWVKK